MLVSRRKRVQGTIEREVLPHLDALYRYALYLTHDRDSAEELSQDTLLKAVNSIALYREGTNCKAWLFKIMTNTFLNKGRKKVQLVELEENGRLDIDPAEDPAAFVQANRTPEESLVSMLSRAKVREAVEALPDEFSSVVVLADLEEFSYKEIAEILACPIGTVMSRLHRGRKLLRTMLMRWAIDLGLIDASLPRESREAIRDEEQRNVTPMAGYKSRREEGKLP